MKSQLVIVHYHLNRGGVTRVIENQLLALRAVGNPFDRIVVVHGGRSDGWPQSSAEFEPLPLELHFVPGLDYDSTSSDLSLDASIDRLKKSLLASIERTGGSAETTLLHVHNHALGKNRALPGSVTRLAESGFRCLLQIHDFAEDLRPERYRHLRESLATVGRPSLATQLYPQAAQIHYAVLNGRDLQVLKGAGVAADRLHYLPNPVVPPPELPDRRLIRQHLDPALDESRPIVLYPVRGIRRKNLGEFLLWAAVMRNDASSVLSLAPVNRAERPNYEFHERLARELQLPVYFDTGGRGGLSWAENLAVSDVMLTTSVAEGFGMVFLESWLAGRPLLGRNLPEITGDFARAAVDLSGLSNEFLVPIDWLGRAEIEAPLRQAYQTLLAAYGLSLPAEPQLNSLIGGLVGQSGVDFARLSPKLQAGVIRRTVQDFDRSLAALLDLNPWLRSAGVAGSQRRQSVVTSNAEAVRRSFGLPAVGQRLLAVYKQLQASAVDDAVIGMSEEDRVLQAFVNVGRLYPLRFA